MRSFACPYFQRAFAFAVPIGGLARLIGLGGGEFRLPVLMRVIGFPAKAAVPLNLVISLATLAFALVTRNHAVPVESIFGHMPEVIGLVFGGIATAFYGTSLVARLSDRRLTQLIALSRCGRIAPARRRPADHRRHGGGLADRRRDRRRGRRLCARWLSQGAARRGAASGCCQDDDRDAPRPLMARIVARRHPQRIARAASGGRPSAALSPFTTIGRSIRIGLAAMALISASSVSLASSRPSSA